MIPSQEIRLYTYIFMELLKNNAEKSKAISELGIIVNRLSRDTKLMSYLSSPDITQEEKKSYIDRKFSKIYSSMEVINFLKLLVTNNRHTDIKEIYNHINSGIN